MKILFFSAAHDTGRCLSALRRKLPEASVRLWAPGAVDPCRYAICWRPPAAFFGGQGQLKAIFNLGAGVDLLTSHPEIPDEVPVIRLDDAGMAEQLEEYVAWCALNFLRGFDSYRRSQTHGRWERLAVRARTEFPIGVMGLGALGKPVAIYLRRLGFPVLGWSRTAKAIDGVACFAGERDLPAFLGNAAMLVCLLPLTAATRGILNRATLSRMPRGAYLVNVARGDHLVEDDCLALLDEGHLAGAALDVFAAEPLPPASPLWRHPRVIVTPHVAATHRIDAAMSQIADKIHALERGEPVTGIVDRRVGY